MASVAEAVLFADFFLFDSDDYEERLTRRKMKLTVVAALHREDRQKVTAYIEETVPNYLPDDFKSFFRISRNTMEVLLQYLSGVPELARRVPGAGRPQIPLEKDILMMLWYIGSQDTIKSIADRFNVSTSTFIEHCRKLLNVMTDHLLKRLIHWPVNAEKHQVKDAFETKKHFPGVLGAIDGCHIQIKKPCNESNDYYNRKGFYSVILQAVCREDKRFTDIYCGWPGKVHDARVFRNSPLSERSQDLCGQDHILGDGAYPLSSHLLTPFRDNGFLTQEQKRYNTALSGTRVVIENAFGMLKNRFRRLKCIELNEVEYIVKTVACACILHNLCILNDDEIPDLDYGNDGFDEDSQCCSGVNYVNRAGCVKRHMIVALIPNH